MKKLTRREFVGALTIAGGSAIAGGLRAWGAEPPIAFKFDPQQNLILAPQAPEDWPAFREQLARWRQAAKQRLNYDDALYKRPEFAWVRTAFCCAFVMLNDETFFDHARGRFTLEEFLAEGAREFGGYDTLVLWHAYPRIGLDDRNQFDFYRDQPGGLKGLRTLARQCHRRGVKVFIDYNPWDTGTRREGLSDLDALAALVKAIEADGIFLDTMDRGAAEFRAKLDAARRGVVLESEGALPLERVSDHHASWAQWFADSAAPGVLRNKWFERRHVLHQIQRWNWDHTAELHTAWMNGTGMMVWENVFGTWVGWNPRDRCVLRAMLPIQRRYARLFCGENWTPLVPVAAPDVYASLWEGDGLQLWTLVNRSDRTIEGALLRTPPRPGVRYFDLIQGREARAAQVAGAVELAGRIGPRGIAAFVAGTMATLGRDFPQFLARQAGLAARADFTTEFPERKAVLRPPERTSDYVATPSGMVAIPGGIVTLKTEFRIRECGFYESRSDHFKGPGGHPLHQPIRFERRVAIHPYAIGLTPVTNAEYAEFLRASRYRPRQPENFLKHWRQGAPPAGQEDHPVVYVDLADAQAYARWAGKRLPTEDEWQYAAQGPDGRRYPWGNEWKPGLCNTAQTGGTTAVTAFPEGRSPFGCYDLCGNTWEWTESERSDGRTRFCIIRGGAFYHAKGSVWYMDGGPQPCDFAAKFLLMWPGLDRCATVGFRCAADMA